ACHAVGASEHQRRPEARGEISCGTRRECEATEERNEVAGDARVLIDQEAEHSTIAQETEDLPGGHGVALPEDPQARRLAVALEHRGDPGIMRLLRNCPAGEAEGGDTPGEKLPRPDVPGDRYHASQPSASPARSGSTRSRGIAASSARTRNSRRKRFRQALMPAERVSALPAGASRPSPPAAPRTARARRRVRRACATPTGLPPAPPARRPPARRRAPPFSAPEGRSRRRP